ncbi:MG2 domain-containing protein [Myxococcus stipitatus]|uniref:MG2 domain-containing protein n=1 Tax=Myxococcus stipitatus TaxID=83455 RepID=UPI001F3FAE7C|nr:MG2 domain-containing protein [Myxococcus stipitatus]MCE9673074.1 MG2 domain-containing protein [Myxococcus stipitatus]
MKDGFRRHLKVGALLALPLVGLWLLASWDLCLSARVFRGVRIQECPDGSFRQTVGVEALALARGVAGEVAVWADAHAPRAETGEVMRGRVVRGSVELFLVDADEKQTPLSPDEDSAWKRDDLGVLRARVKLPWVPDGDYRLRARVHTPLGTDSVDAALALYSRAAVHVLTDRPLYEPGHEVRFRAVALAAKDLSPLEGRPGTWFVKDPFGEVVLEERAPAGPWGVVAGALPLDRGAPTGTWTVSWASGTARSIATFQVEPFTLPRFRVEAAGLAPYFRAGDVPEVEGRVTYASGAPVVDAEVEFEWTPGGSWPPPSEWSAGALPRRARSDAAGRFRVKLPRVPPDLRGENTLSAVVSARDAAGDRVAGAVRLLLVEDSLSVSAVTELADGLVEGFNNRVYLRVQTPDGRVLPGAEVRVRREWDPRDEGVRAVADEDGVASFQLDPGPPVNVVVPPMPVRRVAPPPPVRLAWARDLLAQGVDASPRDLVALEGWLPALVPCARFVSENVSAQEVEVALRAGPGGAVVDVVTRDEPLATCVGGVLRGRAFPSPGERVLRIGLNLNSMDVPGLSLDTTPAFGEERHMAALLSNAALDARACLPSKLERSMVLPATLVWRRSARGEVSTSWIPTPKSGDTALLQAVPCVQERFARLRAEEGANAQDEAMGLVRFSAHPARGVQPADVPSATTFLGYELRVSAKVEGREVGDTKLTLRPATVPPARLRATPVLAKAGEEVRVDLMRGPGFSGTLPKELVLQAGEHTLKEKLAKGVMSARFKLPADFEGWAEARWEGAVARVFVAPKARLSVEVASERPVYAPGALARLEVRTQVDGKAGPAAVGLFGVDESLQQLAPLLGVDALGSVRPAPKVDVPAFGVHDGQALAMGRIRGNNAMAAALLRVSVVPTHETAEPWTAANAVSDFAPDAELTEPFYAVLSELHTRVRAWEEKAAEGETLSAEGMAKLWEQSLEACAARGEKVTDAFGRKLRLSRLPQDLLSLTDPRAVVFDGTRLPEDVENWNTWVAREAP